MEVYERMRFQGGLPRDKEGGARGRTRETASFRESEGRMGVLGRCVWRVREERKVVNELEDAAKRQGVALFRERMQRVEKNRRWERDPVLFT